MKQPLEHREILRPVYLITVIVLLGAGLNVAMVHLHHTVEDRSRNQLEAFHLRTMILAREISGRLADLQARLPDRRETAEAPDSLTAARERSIAVYSIERALRSIVSLQLEHAVDMFQGTVDRAQRRFERILLTIKSGDRSWDFLDQQLAAMALSIYQLDRLHAIAVDEAIHDLTRGSATQTRRTGVVGAVTALIGAIAVVKLLAMLRNRLREHRETSAALLERERELQQSQRMETVGTLVGGVAHDFNNLLTAILGYARMMQMTLPEADPQRSSLQAIRKAAERAVTLTRQLLTFSRPEMVERRVVDLNLLINDFKPLLSRLIRENIEVEIRPAEDLGRVEIDPAQMEQVLMNLAVNARDAMPEGGRITIRTSNVSVGHTGSPPGVPAGDYARVTVEDTGCGMPPKVRERAFEPFFTTKERGRGTGLGLATVYGIVTKSNGYIFIASESGSGARIDVYLPHCAEQVDESIGTDSSAQTHLGGSETILVVEDDDQVREFVAIGLRSSGYRVLVATNGRDALNVSKRHDGPIHLILSDVVMPEMGGPEFVSKARGLHPGVGIVFMSGYSATDILSKVRNSGSPVISKPFTLPELLEVVRRELNDSRDLQRVLASA